MDINLLSESDILVLESLARYKYLTTSHMVRLGIMTRKENLNRRLKVLRERKRALIKCILFSGSHKYQGREYVYYLTKYGVQELILQLRYDDQDIKRPIGRSSLFYRDYEHRMRCVDIQISIYQWAENKNVEVLFYDTYYDVTGNHRVAKNMKAKTTIVFDEVKKKSIIADGIFLIKAPQKNFLFCVEMHNGKDSQRALDQMKNYKEMLRIGAIDKKYHLGINPRILFIFEYEGIMKATMKKLLDSDINVSYYNFFLFAPFTRVQENFAKIWSKANGQSAKLV